MIDDDTPTGEQPVLPERFQVHPPAVTDAIKAGTQARIDLDGGNPAALVSEQGPEVPVPIIVNVNAGAGPQDIAKAVSRATGGVIHTPKALTENGDPMFLRAKEALESISTFRVVEVDHETDIITTSGDGGRDVARYRSGVTEVTITIRGYL